MHLCFNLSADLIDSNAAAAVDHDMPHIQNGVPSAPPCLKSKSWNEQMDTMLASSQACGKGDIFESYTEEFQETIVYYISLILHHET